MLVFDHAIVQADANNQGSLSIDENTVGISIEPAPGSNDGFTYGIGTLPQVHVNAGDPGRNYGFLSNTHGFEFIKPQQISFKWDGIGSIRSVLVIKTMYLSDPNC